MAIDTSWLGAKYGVLAQDAATRRMEGMAQAREANARADLLAQQQEMIRRTTVPGSALFGKTPSYLGAGMPTVSTAPATYQQQPVDTGMRAPETSVYPEAGTLAPQQQSFLEPSSTAGKYSSTAPTMDVLASNTAFAPTYRRGGTMGYLAAKKGIAKVPGKGDGTKDTVPAKLAPGEAVLNKAAADGMGRGLINVLNQMGAKKMGMV